MSNAVLDAPEAQEETLVVAPGKARLIVFDIETYQTRNPLAIERVGRSAIEKKCPGNARKEDKLQWNTEIARSNRAKEALAKTAVDVLLAEPLCLCARMDGEPYSHWLYEWDLRETADRLLMTRQMLHSVAGPETVWCGHNIAAFDLPVILNAWRRYGIEPPEHFPQYVNGRWRGRVFDTMLRTPGGNGLGMVSLDDVCTAFGLGSAKSKQWRGEPFDGSKVAAAFEAGETNLILEYCMDDVEIQEQVYNVLTAGGRWGTFDRHDALAQQIDEIRASSLTEGQKAITILGLLEGAGLVPRAA